MNQPTGFLMLKMCRIDTKHDLESHGFAANTFIFATRSYSRIPSQICVRGLYFSGCAHMSVYIYVYVHIARDAKRQVYMLRVCISVNCHAWHRCMSACVFRYI